jgi:PhzF family phenazine biosynthesis protein
MRIPVFHVDAFCSEIFKGNPAAVCQLEAWLEDSLLQNIAAENGLPETAFLVGNNSNHRIRFFTPTDEIGLCGHAMLASAFVLFSGSCQNTSKIEFTTSRGSITVKREDRLFSMTFPIEKLEKVQAPIDLIEALGAEPIAVYKSKHLLAIFDKENQIGSMNPNFDILKRIKNVSIVIASAKGDSADFVSRVFIPHSNLLEDPVCGVAHCTLAPYWAKTLNKTKMYAQQLSNRGGEMWCEYSKEHIVISGTAALYSKGEIYLY